MNKKLLNLLLVVMMLVVLVPTVLAAPPVQEEGQDYVVVADDWLSKLADKYLGNPMAYPAIVEYTNQKNAEDSSYAKITDPDLIEVGWKVYIPSAAEAEAYVGVAPPVKEGECGFDLLVGANGATFSMNPILARDPDSEWMTDLQFDSLIDLDPGTLEPIPHLAKSWDISEDGMTYTFHLVDADVRWHDGEPFTVEDIEFTVMQILKPTYVGFYQDRFVDLVGADKMIAGEADSLEGFKIVDDRTVQFKLNQPNAAFLASSIDNLKFLPKHLLEGQEITDDIPYSQSPIGTGPYKLKEWEKGVREMVEWNLDYWGEKPCAKSITKLVIADQPALSAALEAGTIDMTLVPPPTEFARLDALPTIKAFKQPSQSPESLWFNLEHPILKDVRVRRAIIHAIDRPAYAEYVMQGSVDPITQHIIPSSWAYDPDPDVPLPEYDPEKAKQLLAEAGYPDGFKISLKTNVGNFTRGAAVEYIQAELAKVGIEVEVEKKEWVTYFSEVLDHDFEMCFLSNEGGIPDPDRIYNVYHTGASRNYSGYSNPEVDELLEQARVVSDLQQRKALYYKITGILHEELPSMPLFGRPNLLFCQSKYDNIIPSALFNYGSIHKWRLVEP